MKRLIFILYVSFAFGYSLLIPLWEAPDENAHYLYALYIARENRAPTLSQNYEALQPSTYYWIASIPLRILDSVDPSLVTFYQPGLHADHSFLKFDWRPDNYRIVWGALVLRWIHIGMGGLTLLLLYHGIRRIVPDAPAVYLGSIALIGLTPQFLHINASVSNDVPAYLAGAFLYWGMAHALTRDLKTWQLALLTAAGLGLPFLVKLNLIAAGLTTLAAILYRLWRANTGSGHGMGSSAQDPRKGFVRLSPFPVPFLLVTSLFITVFLLALKTSPAFSNLFSDFNRRLLTISPGFVWDLDKLKNMARSFWALLGWARVGPPLIVHQVLSILAGVGVLIALLHLLPRKLLERITGLKVVLRTKLASRNKAVFLFNFIGLGMIVLAVLKNLVTTNNLQGRLFFPSFGPIAFLITAGWHAILPRKQWLPICLVAALAALNLYIWLVLVIPIYFQPYLDGGNW